MDLESVDFGRAPGTFSDGSLKVEVKQVLGKVHVKADAPKIDLKIDLILHTDLVDQQFFMMPLNSDGSHYYVNNKANGVPITGTYSFEGKDYACLYEP
jgi:heptaprenylglyceryl phosphate synthase